MGSSIVRPVAVEVRLMGAWSDWKSKPDREAKRRSEVEAVSGEILALLKSGNLRGTWSYSGPQKSSFHHDELGGYKRVTPVEIGTIQLPSLAEDPLDVSLTLQAYQSLVPCYQVWYRIGPTHQGGKEPPTLSWEELQHGYRRLVKRIDDLKISPTITVWTATLDRVPDGLREAGGESDLISPRFFDYVLAQEGSEYRAASWYETSFVGLHLSEGREHYLVVDTDPDRPFRISQLLYLLIGRARAHALGEELHESISDFERHPKLRVEEGVALPLRPSVGDLEDAVGNLDERRGLIRSESQPLTEGFDQVETLREFVRYHTEELSNGKSERDVVSEPPLPRIGWEVLNDYRMRFEGPLNETVQWGKTCLRRARENIDDSAQLLRDQISLILTRRLWLYQWAILALTVLAVGLSLLAIFRS